MTMWSGGVQPRWKRRHPSSSDVRRSSSTVMVARCGGLGGIGGSSSAAALVWLMMASGVARTAARASPRCRLHGGDVAHPGATAVQTGRDPSELTRLEQAVEPALAQPGGERLVTQEWLRKVGERHPTRWRASTGAGTRGIRAVDDRPARASLWTTTTADLLRNTHRRRPREGPPGWVFRNKSMRLGQPKRPLM